MKIRLFENCLGALAAMADMLTQNFVEKCWQKGDYNPARTIRFSALIIFWIVSFCLSILEYFRSDN